MEREGNYAAVGAFVLLVTAMAALFVYWYAGGRDARDYQRYEIYFEGSVSGLNRGGSVRYLGVDVGRVHDIRIDKRAASRVQVIADIDKDAPVSAGTVAELSLQGVTGLLYIDLLANRGNKAMMEPVPSDQYPVINSARSNFDVFISSLPDLVARGSALVERVAKILSDENIAAVSATIANIDKATAQMPATMREINVLVTDLRATSAEFRATALSVRSVTDEAGPEVTQALARVREVADNLATTTAQLDQMLAENRQDVRAFLRDSLPEMQRLLRDSRAAAQEFRALSQSLKSNPAQILFQPPTRGVEIPR
jgi:phospholipid/cholesterol/gamma-HCH transport system substrate-binding protein